MCKDDPADPTQWNKACVYGQNEQCPTPIEIPSGKENDLITYSQWTYGIDEAKKKRDELKNKSAKGKA